MPLDDLNFNGHTYDFDLVTDHFYSNIDTFLVFECLICKYKIYKIYQDEPSIKLYWFVNNLFWKLNYDCKDVLSCEAQQIKNLLE